MTARGLLRYMESGGGVFTFQDDGEKYFFEGIPPTKPPIDTSGSGDAAGKLEPALPEPFAYSG